MAQSLTDYIHSLDERGDLVWPRPPAVKPIKATPSCQPMAGLRGVSFDVYGTLLRIDTGELHLIHPQPLRMSIALEKTIEEFKFWGSMSRKPGQPWEYFLQQYTRLIEEARMAASVHKGDAPEIDAAAIWDKLIERLERNGYQWDRGRLGERPEFAEKAAYFFHASLQGVAPAEDAVDLLAGLRSLGVPVGLIAAGQCFTPAQMLRAFREQRKLAGVGDVVSPKLVVLSSRVGVRQPSPSLYRAAAEAFAREGIEPSQVLHVGCRFKRDLAPAHDAGFRTALVAADANCTHVDKAALRDPDKRPDRLVTHLEQVREILGV